MRSDATRKKVPEQIRLRTENFSRLQSVLTMLGFTLLVLGLLDLAYIVSPMKWTDTQWEMLTVGRLVNNLWGPAFGLALILVPLSPSIGARMLRVRIVCSWLALILGIFFLLLVPLSVRNTVRIVNWAEFRAAGLIHERDRAVKEAIDTLDQLQTPQEMAAYLEPLNLSNQLYREEKNAVALREALKEKLVEITDSTSVTLKDEASRYREGAIRDGIKWSITALIGGIMYVMFWVLSKDYRQTDRSGKIKRKPGQDSGEEKEDETLPENAEAPAQ